MAKKSSWITASNKLCAKSDRLKWKMAGVAAIFLQLFVNDVDDNSLKKTQSHLKIKKIYIF